MAKEYVVRSPTYRQGYQQNSLFARTGGAGKVEGGHKDHWQGECWCDEDACASQQAQQHRVWEQLP